MNGLKLLLNVFFLVALSACAVQAPPPRASGPGPSLTKIRLPMSYIPNVQFAPFYVAVERGYFAEAGIEIEFDYKFETDGVKLVAAGELPFAVVSGEQVVLARSQGLPIKYFVQWYRRFPIAIFSLQTTGIVEPEDLKGKTVGVPGFFGATYVGWRAFLDANGLSEGDLRLEEIGFTQAAAVQQGKVDAAVGYIVNEPIVLEENGFPVNVFRVSDQVDMVANGLITNEKTIQESPKLVRGMARALLRGIADTIADPDAAMQISTRFVEGLKADDPIQKKVLLATIELMKGEQLGASSAQAWENTQNTLLAMGQIQKKMDVNEFFTNAFVP
jgi:NitT/TauT family transport system substrate-binding protein